MIAVYCLNICDFDDAMYNKIERIVSPERLGTANRFRNKEDYKRCLCGDLLLKYCLNKHDESNMFLEIEKNEYGKPYVKNMADFKYNISHSGKWVVIACSSMEVGIDIEEYHENVDDVIDFFSDDEKMYILSENGINKIERFVEIWTMKESYIKYLGMGLSKDLKSFSVDALNGRVFDDGNLIDEVKVFKSRFDSRYYLAVCGCDEKVVIAKLDINDLKVILDFDV